MTGFPGDSPIAMFILLYGEEELRKYLKEQCKYLKEQEEGK